jgi:RNA polymerase sigma-70 factor (ECF subfamily)
MGSFPDSTNIQVKMPAPADLREQDLIRRVQAGEKERFYELIKPYERRVYAAAFGVLRNEADAPRPASARG